MDQQKTSEGRIVHYGIGRDYAGNVVRRPAVIVNSWGGSDHPNIQVLLDGSNDSSDHYPTTPEGERWAMPTAEECTAGHAWRTSCNQGTNVGEWCWPPRT